eukprot:238247-Chlamydomonas_euryale.AAC.1
MSNTAGLTGGVRSTAGKQWAARVHAQRAEQQPHLQHPNHHYSKAPHLLATHPGLLVSGSRVRPWNGCAARACGHGVAACCSCMHACVHHRQPGFSGAALSRAGRNDQATAQRHAAALPWAGAERPARRGGGRPGGRQRRMWRATLHLPAGQHATAASSASSSSRSPSAALTLDRQRHPQSVASRGTRPAMGSNGLPARGFSRRLKARLAEAAGGLWKRQNGGAGVG